LFKLIANENTKIYRRWRTWILLALVVIAIALLGWIQQSSQTKADVNWKQTLVTQNASLQKRIDDHGNRMPHVAVNEIRATIITNQYYIDHNTPPSKETAWTFSQTASNISTLTTAFIIVIAGDIVASEFATGTIKMLLTQPATRTRILISKYLATLLFGLFAMALMFVVALVIGGILFGFGGATQPILYTNPNLVLEHMPGWAYLLTVYGFSAVSTLMTVTIAFMVSTIFRSSALAITIAILATFVGGTLVTVLSRYTWVKYVLFTNVNLEQYMRNGPLVKGMTLGFSIGMLVLYFVLMNLLSWAIFVKRDVASS